MTQPRLLGAALPCLFLPAQPSAPTRAGDIVDKGARRPSRLDRSAQASSRPARTIRDTPVSAEVLEQTDLRARGVTLTLRGRSPIDAHISGARSIEFAPASRR